MIANLHKRKRRKCAKDAIKRCINEIATFAHLRLLRFNSGEVWNKAESLLNFSFLDRITG